MDEKFFTGYCRMLDASRTVCAEFWDGKWEPDCQFENCPYAQDCPIGRELAKL